MANFDTQKTRELVHLFQTPHDKRDRDWVDSFFSLIDEASMMTSNPQIIRGPDGFPYFSLSTPKDGEEFEPYCLNHILDFCLNHGAGIVVNPSKPQPDFVFSYGHLWLYKTSDSFWPDENDNMATDLTSAQELMAGQINQQNLPEGKTVFLGQPSETLFPPTPRKILRRFFKEAMGLKEPKVLLIVNPTEKQPPAVAFNLHVEDFKTQQDFNNALFAIKWFIPDTIGLASVPKQSEWNQRFGLL